MHKLLQILRRNERGQGLIIVLITVAVGGLLAAATLGYAGTILKNNIAEARYVNRLCAAEAGVEDALWSMKNHITLPSQYSLPQDLNNARVTLNYTPGSAGIYNLFSGAWSLSVHADFLNIKSTIETLGGNNYLKIEIAKPADFDITKNITIDTISAQLPAGYTYQSDSTTCNFMTLLDSDISDQLFYGVHILTWTLGSHGYQWSNTDNGNKTITFQITGNGDLHNYYSWIHVQSHDIGYVGELSGSPYTIIATATSTIDNKSTTITATVMYDGTNLYIISWQVDP